MHRFTLTKVSLFVAISLAAVPVAAEKSLIRIATMPAGAEVTGLSTNVYGDLFLNAQHTGGKNEFKDDAPPAIVGYVTGLDSSTATASMAIPDEGKHNQVNVGCGWLNKTPADRNRDVLFAGDILS